MVNGMESRKRNISVNLFKVLMLAALFLLLYSLFVEYCISAFKGVSAAWAAFIICVKSK